MTTQHGLRLKMMRLGRKQRAKRAGRITVKAGDGGKRREDRIRTCRLVISMKYSPDSLRAQAFGANVPAFKPRPSFLFVYKTGITLPDS